MSLKFGRLWISGVAGILLLGLAGPRVRADEGWEVEYTPAARGTYVGVFGGGGVNNIGDVSQVGTAFFAPAAGGPLDVHATGSSGTNGVGIVGVQIGHEWSRGAGDGVWGLMPAVECEAYYMSGTQHANVNNPTTRLPEHVFDDVFPMNNAVILTNTVLSLRTPLKSVTPYVGGGIGAACITINNANSPQVAPAELGVNHFNSGPDSSAWGFAAQVKVGVRFALTKHAYLFTEYRYLYVGSTTYVFGSTVYPTHVPTTDWTVHFGDMSNHMGVAGIGFSF